MFGVSREAIELAENLNHVYFELKCDKDKLHYLETYLQEKGFEKDRQSKDKNLGQQIVQYKDPTGKLGIANLKHNPHNEYQLLIQFIGTQHPLQKKTKSREILEELLSACGTQTLNCGYINNFKGNVFCHYNGKNFYINNESLARYKLQQEIKNQRTQRNAYALSR